MNRLERAAILSSLVEELRSLGSWAGETHVQKATYFLQHAAGVPLDFDFVLYKHGPFSFGLREELSGLDDEGLLVFEPQPYPYGPKLFVTPLGNKNRQLRSEIVDAYGAAIAAVAEFVGQQGVSSLERVATALMLHLQEPVADENDVARRLVLAKPHVSQMDALVAVRQVRALLPTLQQVA